MVSPDQLKFLMRNFRKKNKQISVPLDRIEPHPNYPEERLKDLKEIEDSIKREGFSEKYPLRATPHPTKRGYYQLVDGHRRLEAAKRCFEHPDCAGNHLQKKVPIIVGDYSREELDEMYREDNWKRYPIPRKKAQFKNPRYCPQCGTKLMPGDHYCPECGFRIRWGE